MKSLASRLFPRKAQKRGGRSASVRPRLEVLEDRVVPALTYHSGPVLSAVQVQALYLGSGWSSAAISTSQFDGFLNTTVSGTTTNPAPYLAMLNKAGFTGVTGAGSVLKSATDGVTPVPTGPTDLLDSQIQTDLQRDVQNGLLTTPTKNTTLYFVFVQPGTVVDFGNGRNQRQHLPGLPLLVHLQRRQGPLRRRPLPRQRRQRPGPVAELLRQHDRGGEPRTGRVHHRPERQRLVRPLRQRDRRHRQRVHRLPQRLRRPARVGHSRVAVRLPRHDPRGRHGQPPNHLRRRGRHPDRERHVAVANPTAATGHAEASTSQVVSISTQGVDDFGQPMVDVRVQRRLRLRVPRLPGRQRDAGGQPRILPLDRRSAPTSSRPRPARASPTSCSPTAASASTSIRITPHTTTAMASTPRPKRRHRLQRLLHRRRRPGPAGRQRRRIRQGRKTLRMGRRDRPVYSFQHKNNLKGLRPLRPPPRTCRRPRSPC